MDDQFKNSRYPLPEKIRKGRNIAIILGFLELICCGFSFWFYDVRRSRLLLAIIIISCCTTAGGFYAKLKLNYCGILAHAIYTIPIIGGYYIYILVESIFRTDNYTSNAHSDTWIQLVSSVPLLGLFIMGIYSCVLAIMLEDELEQRKKSD